MDISFVENPTEEVINALRNGLASYNRTYLGLINEQDFALLLHDTDGRSMGGMTGTVLGPSLLCAFFG